MNKKTIKIFISGQISGLPLDEAKAKFDQAENDAVLSVLCISPSSEIETINPMKIVHDHELSWEAYMKADIGELLKCNFIFMINNWQTSKGARIEHAIAIQLGLPVIYSSKFIF